MQITRLEVGIRPERVDARGEEAARRVRSFLGLEIDGVRSCDVYHLQAELAEGEAERVLHEFVDPVLQHGALGRLEQEPFDVAVRVGYKPGVTDPVGKSARVAVEDTLGRSLGDQAAVYCSRMYFLRGVNREQGRRIAVELLANPVIQTVTVRDFEEWSSAAADLTVPRVQERPVPPVRTIDLVVRDVEVDRAHRPDRNLQRSQAQP